MSAEHEDTFVRAPLAESTSRFDPKKVIGFGHPASVAVTFHPCEVPALLEAVRAARADYERRTTAEHGGWDDHIGELGAMLADIAARHPRREFKVVWPTVLAYDVIRRAVAIAVQRVYALTEDGADLSALAPAQAAAAAALRTARALEAVDGGGRQDVWL